MLRALEHAFGPAVALTGAVAATAGVALLVLDVRELFAAFATAAGFLLVAWVIFHPGRAV